MHAGFVVSTRRPASAVYAYQEFSATFNGTDYIVTKETEMTEQHKNEALERLCRKFVVYYEPHGARLGNGHAFQFWHELKELFRQLDAEKDDSCGLGAG